MSTAASQIPEISARLQRGFAWYARRYIRRHFNAMRLLRAAAPPPDTEKSTVFFLNHASWWDPLVALHLAETYYPRQRAFAPIDAEALQKYPIMERLGFFPVERDTARGARQFLRSARAILAQPWHALWLTPQGHFTDARQRPVRFQSGLSHLAAKLPQVNFVPVAIEYSWWFERSPEILVAFGKPVHFPPDATPAWLSAHCETALAGTQDQLAAGTRQRQTDAFDTLITGRAGVGGVYDLWRSLRARLRGESFAPRHHSEPR